MNLDNIILFILNIYLLGIIFSMLILFFSKRKLKFNLKNKNLEIYYLKSLSFLHIFYMTSPFLGLIGTIYRIIEVFKNKALFENSSNAFNLIVFHLGEALEMTIYGISIALFSLIFYIYYKNEFRILWLDKDE